MLSVNINRDVEQYQESVMAGMNAKQTIAILAALLIGAGAVCFGYFFLGIPIEMAVYLAVPFSAPIILSVFGKDGDITIWEKIRGAGKKQFFYGSTEIYAVRVKRSNMEDQDRRKWTLRHSVTVHKEERNESEKSRATKKENFFKRRKNKADGPI